LTLQANRLASWTETTILVDDVSDDSKVVQFPGARNGGPDWEAVYAAYLQGVSFRDLARMPEAAGVSGQAIHAHAKTNDWVRDDSAEARIRARQDVAFYADQEARQKKEWNERENRMTPSAPKRRGRPPGKKNKPQAEITPEEEIIRQAPPAQPLRVVEDDFTHDGAGREDASDEDEGSRATWPVDAQALPDPEPDPLPPPPDGKVLTSAETQARNLTRVGLRQQRRISELHDAYRMLLHGFKSLAELPTDHPDFGYFAGKFLGAKDSLADLARKIAYVNGILQRDERVAYDMNAERVEELKPFVPQLGRRASPLAGVNPYRNGTIPAPGQPAQDVAEEKKKDDGRVADAS
jgi:hypothetical protein